VIDHRSIADGPNAPTNDALTSKEAVHTTQVALIHMALMRPTSDESPRLRGHRYGLGGTHLQKFRQIFEASAADLLTHKCSEEELVLELALAAERALFAVGVEREPLL
jgi:hypothetical protein